MGMAGQDMGKRSLPLPLTFPCLALAHSALYLEGYGFCRRMKKLVLKSY